MASSDPLPTHRDVHAWIPAELVAAGFENPEEIGRGGFSGVVPTEDTALAMVPATSGVLGSDVGTASAGASATTTGVNVMLSSEPYVSTTTRSSTD